MKSYKYDLITYHLGWHGFFSYCSVALKQIFAFIIQVYK